MLQCTTLCQCSDAPTSAGAVVAGTLQEQLLQDDRLTLVDLVSFDHCQEVRKPGIA